MPRPSTTPTAGTADDGRPGEAPDERELRRRLDDVTIRDAHRLRRRLDQARSVRDPDQRRDRLRRVADDVVRAEGRLAGRRAAVPQVVYPEALPVSARRDEIAAAVRDHQVVVLAGETGSGKTTQLPKICLDLGRGVRGAIGHTQPRRIAARTVAERIAEECEVELGGAVGYAVRFHDQVGEDTLVKVMTDGLLLAEIRSDPLLRAYDTIIIDEAHERSLSIDFLLGYLHRILPRRPDLKLIITSATIDPGRFAALFDGAPVIEVSGRTYPVEVRYRPVADRDDGDTLAAISDAVDELDALGRAGERGDILVFLSGEREIRDTAEMLERRDLPRTEVLPLYARLSSAEQHRVFQPHTGRRIVLATNVAETSLTVPGIKYVIDPGTARISRYSQRLKVQRLPIEAISQASANQRAGRCGRTSDGVCVRLYAEDDFDGRPEFTDPEILRTSLASVILSMISLDLGEIDDFGFLDPPDRRAVRDGLELLTELGAIDPEGRGRSRLTDVGRTIAGLPLDPRMARMLVEADRLGCLADVLVIASALSIQDPRERPPDAQAAADAHHRRFADPDSDFAAYLHLWTYLKEQRHARSSSAFRRMCRDEHLHHLRVREWSDVHSQLRQAARDLGMTVPPGGAEVGSADRALIHRAVLSGLLSHLGLREADARDYLGARNARFAIFPGSGLAKKPPRWVMAAELVETSRLWGRTAARIEPDWVEELAAHLLRRTYSEPRWSKRRGAVVATERATLYGVPIVVDRTVQYGRIDPELSRELFLRHALVEGDWETRHAFFAANRALLEEVDDLEERARRRDIRVDDETLFAFYDERVGPEVVSGRHFDTWWKRTRREQPDLLDLERSLLIRADATTPDEQAYPDVWTSGPRALPLSYVFEPGQAGDGITVDVELVTLPDLDPGEFWWQVPGHREELVATLIRSLPKPLRRSFVPAPQVARDLLADLDPSAGTLPEVLARVLHRRSGQPVTVDDFDLDRVPEHLRVRFRVLDGATVVAEGKDLARLQEQLRPRVQDVLSEAADAIGREGLTSWGDLVLPATVEVTRHGQTVRGWPTLVDRGASVDVRVVESEAERDHLHPRGLRRMLALTTSSPVPALTRALGNRAKLALADSPYPSVLALLEDVRDAALDSLVAEVTAPVRDAEAFAALRETARAEVHDRAEPLVRTCVDVLGATTTLRRALADAPPALADVVDDLRVQLSWLVYDGLVADVGAARLADLPRYLRAASYRLERAPAAGPAEARDRAVVQELEGVFHDRTADLPAHLVASEPVQAARWALEELRVSLFAQPIGTRGAVSPKRVRRLLDALPR